MKGAVAEMERLSIVAAPAGLSLEPVAWLREGTSSATITLRSRVWGENLAFLYLLVGRRLHVPNHAGSSRLLALADLSFVDPLGWSNRNGQATPDWGDEPRRDGLSFEISWTPALVAVTDGVRSVPALLEPLELGPTESDTVYQLDCVYLPRGSSSPCPVPGVMLFQAGVFTRLVLEDPAQSGEMLEATVIPGDRFLIYHHVIERPEAGSTGAVAEDAEASATFLAGELVYGEDGLSVIEIPVDAGRYMLGVVAEDSEGRLVESLAEVELEAS